MLRLLSNIKFSISNLGIIELNISNPDHQYLSSTFPWPSIQLRPIVVPIRRSRLLDDTPEPVQRIGETPSQKRRHFYPLLFPWNDSTILLMYTISIFHESNHGLWIDYKWLVKDTIIPVNRQKLYHRRRDVYGDFSMIQTNERKEGWSETQGNQYKHRDRKWDVLWGY